MTQARAEFLCGVCGAVAATLWFDDDARLHVECFGHTTHGSGMHEPARAQIEAANVRGLYAIDRMLIPFYCPECDCMYCEQHWTLDTQFDSDFAGWYDCTYGTCPKGHRRMVDD